MTAPPEHLVDLPLPGGGRTSIEVRPGGFEDDPVLLLLPAMGVPAGYYGPFLDGLADEGVAAAVVDQPGHGRSRPRISRRVDYGYTDLADTWVPAARRAVSDLLPGRPLVLMGHSMGGQTLLAHLARHTAAGLAGVILIGAGSPYWRAQSSPLLLLQTQLVGVAAQIYGHWPGPAFGFGGHQPRTLMAEWARYARTGRLAPGGEPVEEALRSVDLPVLAVDLDADTLAPPASVDHLVAKLPSASVRRWAFVKGEGDPGRPVDHFSFARSPEIIAAHLATWARSITRERDGARGQDA